MSTDNNILTVKNLSKSFFKKSSDNSNFYQQLKQVWTVPQETDLIWALNDVSFDLKKGEILGIVGKNGAGKSTLLKILSEITAPTSGEIEYEGKLTSIIDIGTGFHPDLSGKENVKLVSHLLATTQPDYDAIVAFSGLADYMDMPVKHYSSGMYLRLAFSVAFHSDIDILLLDEVLAVGDADFKRKCNTKIRELSGNGTAIIMVSHNMDALLEHTSRCLLLENGQIESMGDPLEIIERYLEKTALFSNEKIGATPVPLHANQENITYLSDLSSFKHPTISLENPEIIVEGKNPNDPIYMKDKIDVHLTFNKLVPDGSIEIIWYLTNMNDQRIFNDSYGLRPDYKVIDLPKGKYITKCSIPHHLLNKGSYTLGLIISQNGVSVIKEFPEVVRFKVIINPENKFDMQITSIIRPQLEWELKKIPN